MIAPEFWNYFKTPKDEHEGLTNFYKAISRLYNHYDSLLPLTVRLEKMRTTFNISKSIYNEETVVAALKLILRATILSQLPIDYKCVIENFYEVMLRFQDKGEADDDSVDVTEFDETNRFV